MRPNNQNKQRSRGRSGGGRRHGSPLSRNYESNGPEVKIRGNASTVAEKYLQLARDAQSSGDSVMEQNYLQHAEHYFRIVSAAQALIPQRNEPQGQQPTTQDEKKPEAGASNKSENTGDVEATASPVASPEGDTSEAVEATSEEVAEPPARKPRERRPRRKPRVQETAGENPADAPQPEVGELPAFLTGGGQTDAAE